MLTIDRKAIEFVKLLVVPDNFLINFQPSFCVEGKTKVDLSCLYVAPEQTVHGGRRSRMDRSSKHSCPPAHGFEGEEGVVGTE
jgi:hypothetical protein